MRRLRLGRRLSHAGRQVASSSSCPNSGCAAPSSSCLLHQSRRKKKKKKGRRETHAEEMRLSAIPKTEFGLTLRAIRLIHLLQRTIRTYLLRTRNIGRRRHILLSKGRRRRDLLLRLLSDDKPLTLAAGHSPPPSTFLLLLDMLSFIGVSLTSSLSPFPYPKNLQRHKNLRGELFFGRCEHISPNVWRFPFQEPRKTFFPHSNSLNCFFSLLSSDTSPPF